MRRYRPPSPRADGTRAPCVFRYTNCDELRSSVLGADARLIVVEIGGAPHAPIRAALRVCGCVVSVFLRTEQ